MSHHNSQRPLLLPRGAYDAHNAAADHCKIFAKSLALDAECLAASKNYDAARAWSLLGSRAQNILKALCAAGEAPAVSAGSSEPAASRARTASGLARCPEDVLGAIVAFVDLPMRFTCVAACSTLRDACTRLSPRLEHSLVVKRFPLLRSFSDIATAPRELFRTFKEFEGENTYVVRPESSIALDAYTLSLVITAREIEHIAPGQGWRYTGTQEAICVGTGEFQSEAAPRVVYNFTIPEAAHERARQLDAPASSWRLLTTVVASRRGASGRLQFAKLHHEECRVRGQGDEFFFENTEIPLVAGNQALNFIKWRADDSEMYTDPVLELDAMGPSTVEAIFKWISPNDSEDMTVHDARCCLEHYLAWSE